MKILLTNDDGYDAPGILALLESLSTSHEVILIAPDRENSAVGHGITLHEPLRIIPVKNQLNCYAVTGTPVDCIKLGLFNFFRSPPDLVISGINNGSNLGVDINYSGTAAAARESALNGIPSIAISISHGVNQDYPGVAVFIKKFIEDYNIQKIPQSVFVNINAPGIRIHDNIKIKKTQVARTNVSNHFVKKQDPKNRNYYWYGNVEQVEAEPGTDIYELSREHITISLIRCDMTADLNKSYGL